MERDYGPLINLATELNQFRGYLTSEDQQRQSEAQGRYNEALRAFVYKLLSDGKTSDEASQLIIADLEEIASYSDESWRPLYDEVRGNLLGKIEEQAERKPWQRTLRHRLPLIAGIIILVGYFGLRLYSATPVEAPLATRAGIQQRASAYLKAARYDDWMSTRVRRGGLFKGILLWPIEPSQSELKGAGEFAGLVLEGHSLVINNGAACKMLSSSGDNNLSDSQLDFINEVARRIKDQVRWSDPPALTLIDVMRTRPPC